MKWFIAGFVVSAATTYIALGISTLRDPFA
jgi:hypothetical protein